MTELKIVDKTMPSANLGPENPMPQIFDAMDIHADIKTDESYPADELENLGWGRPDMLLPYRLLDGFDRNRKPRNWKSVVLENEHLRAEFIPELGGHLWSLFSKDSNRELLSVNPDFQPCNLALRKAWISGGVEWNFGWTGHWPMTCSPLFAARHTLPDGTPALRMWEFERVRRVTVQIDTWLPSDSKVLFVRISLHNTRNEMVPAYWWSNIAVEQHKDTRVVVSADEVILFNYATSALGCHKLPICDGDAVTWPGKAVRSKDAFFRVPPSEMNPWIAAVEPDGRGLFQTSTSLLRGRKLFRWGVQKGGDNWQEFLRSPAYIEIQAGLARTQSHHLPMPANATWTWVEAYGDVATDPAISRGDDWTAARANAAAAVRAAAPAEMLDKALADSMAWGDKPVDDFILEGSGWGGLEEARRKAAGEAGLGTTGISFSEKTAAATGWLDVVNGGIIPETDVSAEPGAFAPTEMLTLVEKSLALPGGRNWRSLFHYGVILWQAKRQADAVAAWEESCKLADNAWSRHCLASAYMMGKKPAEMLANMAAAHKLLPQNRTVAIEYMQGLVDNGRADEAVAVANALAEPLRGDARIRFVEATAMMYLGKFAEVEKMLETAQIPDDMREGEVCLCELWIANRYYATCKDAAKPYVLSRDVVTKALAAGVEQPPIRIDYRMS